ncbi:MAG: FAD binding domain-containing protein [Actinomycetota bacterium]|nr:FAD binding domain-containing protein [Actinomycetota bacterium]
MTGTSAADAAFLVPSTVEAAVEALGDAGPGAVALAGGTSIGLLIGQGLLAPSALVWLGRIPELSVLQEEDERMSIGATVTLAALAADPRVRSAAPALADAAASVGNTRVRAVATIGGALVHADPRQDLPPVLLALDARVEVAGRGGRRCLAVDQLIDGYLSTDLGQEEVVTAVRVPLVDGRRSCYLRFTPGSADDYPTVAAAASVRVVDGVPTAVHLAIGGAGPTAYLVPEAEEVQGAPARRWAKAVAEVAEAAARRADPVDDRLGSAAYKRRMVAVWARRALERCLCAERAEGWASRDERRAREAPQEGPGSSPVA